MSFTAAAQELGVSQPAVSKSIKATEQNLGFDLFVRNKNGLKFTARGKVLANEVTAVLSQLEKATKTKKVDTTVKSISVTFSSSFVSMWLLPRLPEFKRAHPGITFKIVENSGRPQTRAEMNFDFSSRLGMGEWKDVTAWEYAPEVLYAVASPDYAASCPDVSNLKTLHKADLLHAIEAGRTRTNWAEWFKAAGEPDVEIEEEMMFSDYHSAIHAALLGQGVALGWQHLIGLYVNENRLQCVSGAEVRSGKNFYLVTPVGRQLEHHHLVFRDWLIEQSQINTERINSLAD